MQNPNYSFGSVTPATQSSRLQDPRDDVEMTPALAFGGSFLPPSPSPTPTLVPDFISSSVWGRKNPSSSSAASTTPSAASSQSTTVTSSAPSSSIQPPKPTDKGKPAGDVSENLHKKSGSADAGINKRKKTTFQKGAEINRSKNNTNPCSRRLQHRIDEMQDKVMALTEEFPVLKTLQEMPSDKNISLSSLLVKVQDLLTEFGSHYRFLRAARSEYEELTAVLDQHNEAPEVAENYENSEYSTPRLYHLAVRKELKDALKRSLPAGKVTMTEEEVRTRYRERLERFNRIGEEDSEEMETE